MAAYTWTKEKCNACGHVQRTRGVHKGDAMTCFYCRAAAGENSGKTIKRA